MPPRQPVLQYSSAFDDELAADPEGGPSEPPHAPEGVLECVLEEPPEAAMDAAQEPQLEAEPGRPPSSAVHGPYYYFYQGGSLPAPSRASGLLETPQSRFLSVSFK